MKSMLSTFALLSLCSVSLAGLPGGVGFGGLSSASTVQLDNQRANYGYGIGYGIGYGGLGSAFTVQLDNQRANYGYGIGLGHGGVGYGVGLGHGVGFGKGIW